MNGANAGRGSMAWMSRCMQDAKTSKLQQLVRPYPVASAEDTAETMPVRGVVATARLHRGEHIGTVKRECVLTGARAAQWLRQTCKGQRPASPNAHVIPLSAQRFENVATHISSLPAVSSMPPHLLLSRDALLMTVFLFLARSPLNTGVLLAHHPLRTWVDALPRRIPPMGVLLQRSFLSERTVEPLPRRLRLGGRTKDITSGDDVAVASTELMIQSVEEGEVALADLRHPNIECALTPMVRTSYFKGQMPALTQRQLEAQRARRGTANTEGEALHILTEWEQQVNEVLGGALLPLLILPAEAGGMATEALRDSSLWQEEEAALRWAHFMIRSRAVNLHWRRPGPPQLSVIPLIDMLNHTAEAHANVVYHCEDNGDVVVTAARTIQAGEELVLRYHHLGQRGCLFGDVPPPPPPPSGAVIPSSGALSSSRAAAVAAEVRKTENRQLRELYAQDDDDDEEAAALCMGSSSSTSTAAPTYGTRCSDAGANAALAKREMRQEVEWLWRFGFLRSREEKNREAALLWSRGLRQRIAHLTDVRRKGRPGEFVVGVPEGLQHLREQRAELERDRYHNARVFPPLQP